jgi:hypothetical protein
LIDRGEFINVSILNVHLTVVVTELLNNTDNETI